MTQAEVQAHPFWGKFQQRIGPVINAMTQRGLISPNESGVLMQILRNSYPMMHQLIENLNMRYSEMNDPQMDSEIYNWIQPAVQQAKIKVQQMTGGFGRGFGGGGFGMGGGFGGGGFGFGGGGAPVGFGFDSMRGGSRPGAPGGVPTSPWGGAAGKDTFAASGSSGGIASLFGGDTKQPTQRDKQVADQMKPQAPAPVTPVSWKEPAELDAKTFNLDGSVEVTTTKFELYDGSKALNVIVHDQKVGYTSDSEVIEKYKGIFDIFPEASRKILTVAYQQLKVLHVSREEMVKMVQAITAAAGKMNTVEAKIRAIISSAGHFNKNAYEEFVRMFIDELEFHIQCGELCDSFHPKNILNRPRGLEDVLAWITGDVGKDMAAAMKGMEGFTERLNKLLEILVEEFATGLNRRILNPQTDMTMLDDFYRALPGMWTEDYGITFRNTEDLVNIFLATRETVDGSKSATAVKADSELKKKLDDLCKQFTLLFVPRTVTWCNYAKSAVCRYDEAGNCQPAVTSRQQPRNDVEFFLNGILDNWSTCRDTMVKWAPRNVYMEVDEETFCLQYGYTTNNCLWCGCSKFWH